MGTDGWRSGRSLNEQLARDYGDFNYYQLVRLLRAGGGGRVRFRGDLGAAFPGREVSAMERSAGDVTLRTPNYTIAGGIGPLPDSFADWVRARARDGDRSMAEFLDLFVDGVNRLRYDVKERLDPGLASDAPDDGDLAHYLGNLVGLWGDDLKGRRPLPLRALLGVAGLLADHRRSGATLTRILCLYLRAPVELEPLRGRWHTIDEEERTRLGRANHTLGRRSVLGGRVWDQMAAVALRIGPLPYARFCELLPDGEDHARFAALARFITRRRVDFEVELLLDPADRPPAALAAHPSDDEGIGYRGLRLGWSAWLDGPGKGDRSATYSARYTLLAHEAGGDTRPAEVAA